MSRSKNNRNKQKRKLRKEQEWGSFHQGDVYPSDFDMAWVNNKYQVFSRVFAPELNGFGCEILWLSIKSHDRAPVRDWRDFQRIKNELAGTTCEAMEIYPAEDRLVDASNQYHLWVFPPELRIPTGWPARDVIEDQAHFEKEFGINKGRQRKIAEHHRARELPKNRACVGTQEALKSFFENKSLFLLTRNNA